VGDKQDKEPVKLEERNDDAAGLGTMLSFASAGDGKSSGSITNRGMFDKRGVLTVYVLVEAVP